MNPLQLSIQNIGSVPYGNVIILVLALWTLLWKGIALWFAAKGGNKYWFVLLLIINTLGLFEIIFLILRKYGIVKPVKGKSIAVSSAKKSSLIKQARKV